MQQTGGGGCVVVGECAVELGLWIGRGPGWSSGILGSSRVGDLAVWSGGSVAVAAFLGGGTVVRVVLPVTSGGEWNSKWPAPFASSLGSGPPVSNRCPPSADFTVSDLKPTSEKLPTSCLACSGLNFSAAGR